MDICRQVGRNVRKFRTNKGWSQEDLAYEADYHRTYISGIERGVRNPTVTVIARLAKVLDVRPGRLLDG